MSAPLVLLPPSKGKSDVGSGPAYARTLAAGHPLTQPRRRVLEAVLGDVPGLDDAALRRVAGVAAREVPEVRTRLATLDTAATAPAHRRYTGVVHGNAGLAQLDPDDVDAAVRIVSPLLGLVALDEPVPAYRLELSARLPSLGGLGAFWRDALAEHLATLGDGRRVWDLLPAEHRRIWQHAPRTELDVVEVRFVRPDGRAANAARTKVAKGRIAAALVAEPDLAPADLASHVRLDSGWELAVEPDGVAATYRG